MLFVLLACMEKRSPEERDTEKNFETSENDTGEADEEVEYAQVEFTATLQTAEREESGNNFITEVIDAPGASFWVTPNDPEGVGHKSTEEEPADTVASGTTPATVSLKPGTYCVAFSYTSGVGTPYISNQTCFDTASVATVAGELCVALRSDWICEDMWGEEGTPDTFYTTRDIEMESCEVELYGITWVGQPAVFDGHLATFALGSYKATGAIDEWGTSMEWFIDYEVDYWTTCAMMY